jgi:hypothetical protein
MKLPNHFHLSAAGNKKSKQCTLITESSIQDGIQPKKAAAMNHQLSTMS